MEREKYYNELGWGKSPFIKSTSLDIPIIQRGNERERVKECIGGWDRIMVVTAPIGYGKTTFMNSLITRRIASIEYVVSFDAYEPVDAVLKKILKSLPALKRLFVRTVDRTEFGAFLQKKLGDKKLLLLFDEAQDYDEELFRWLRILNDRANNVFMIFFGLPNLENKITAEASFRDRKSKSIRLSPFATGEMRDIVVERIGWVGGNGFKPFTEGGLKRLSESANNIPRRLLENGQTVIEGAAANDVFEINGDFVEGVLGYFEEPVVSRPVEVDEVGVEVSENIHVDSSFLDDLSPTQNRIVELLMDNEDLSISELGDELDSDIRSVGSLIRKLRGLDRGEVMRKPDVPYPIVVRKGKDKRNGRLQFVYGLSDNVRRLVAKK